MAAPILPG